jgi:hypothetical protein
MKKHLFIASLFVASILTTTVTLEAQTTDDGDAVKDYCNWYTAKKNSKKQLVEYTYDSGKLNKFNLTENAQKKEIEVPLFSGNEYRLVFNTEGMPDAFEINIFNEKSSSKTKKLLFSKKVTPGEMKEFVYEPEGAKKLYVNYDIPAVDEEKNACMLFLVGYKSTKKKNKKADS